MISPFSSALIRGLVYESSRSVSCVQTLMEMDTIRSMNTHRTLTETSRVSIKLELLLSVVWSVMTSHLILTLSLPDHVTLTLTL